MRWQASARICTNLACAVTVHCPKPVTLFAADSRIQLARFLLTRRGMLTSSVNEAVAFVRSNPTLIAPDLEFVWLPVPLLGEGLTPAPGHGLTLGVELLQPDSHGDIRLASDNPADPPIIDPATSPPSRTCETSKSACASPNRYWTPRRYARTSAPPWPPGWATSTMTRTWRPSFASTPKRHPPRRHLPHGQRRRRGGGLPAPGPRPGRAADRRRVGDATDHPRPHPGADRHDRRTCRRPHPTRNHHYEPGPADVA